MIGLRPVIVAGQTQGAPVGVASTGALNVRANPFAYDRQRGGVPIHERLDKMVQFGRLPALAQRIRVLAAASLTHRRVKTLLASCNGQRGL